MGVSINDVAKRAGVSISTVSRIVNGTAKVAAQKEAAVRKAIAELQYEPNQLGRGLAKQCTQLVGIYFYGGISLLDSTYNLELLKGAEEVLTPNGYSLLLLSDKPNVEVPSFYRYIRERRIDALLVSGLSSGIRQDSVFRELIDSDFPISYIGKCFHEKGLNVYAQFEEYHVEMVRILRTNGHRKILIFQDVIHDHYIQQVKLRIGESFSGVELQAVQLSQEDIPNIDGILSAAVSNGFTAACCPTIHDAVNLIHSCARLDFSVPEQISIIAVEHRPEEGRDYYPAISAMYVPARQMGRVAAEQLLTAMGRKAEQRKHIEFHVAYTERNSIAERNSHA